MDRAFIVLRVSVPGFAGDLSSVAEGLRMVLREALLEAGVREFSVDVADFFTVEEGG